MRTFLLTLAGTFVALCLFVFVFFALLIGLIASAASARPAPPSSVVLTLDLNTEFPDQAPATGFAAFSGAAGFIDIQLKLKDAELDDSVKGLLVRAPSAGIGTARAEELREAIRSFREAGKFVVAHVQNETISTSSSRYHAISAADEIWFQPGGDLFMQGVSFEGLFFRNLFENIGLESQIYALYEYKNAPNAFNETGYTASHREALEALAESLWATALSDIAEDRGIPVETLRRILEDNVLTAEAALENGLADQLGWPEDAIDAVKQRAGSETELVELTGYTPPRQRGRSRAPLIAIVGGEGTVVTGGGSSGSPFSSPPGFASDIIARAILDASENDNVKAIIFRVESGGGSPAASDQIWRAIERAKEADKPVIVSMGGVAASAAYAVSAGADSIVANRATVTGSIGIFGGKFALEGAFNRIGLTTDSVDIGGDMTGAFGTAPFTATQEAEIRAWLARGYERFLEIVAEGREMSRDEVHAVARGRVWSGAEALEIGLVDEIGTFTHAIEVAKDLAGIDTDVRPRFTYYPRRRTGFEALEGVFGTSAETAQTAARLGALAGDKRVQRLAEELALIEALNSGQALAIAPEVRER